MTSSAADDDLDNFVLPSSLAHHSWVGKPHETDEYGINRNTPSSRWMSWILKLKFTKGGVEKNGNGFLVNIPNEKYDVVLTAGHNLVEKANTYTTDLRIILSNTDVIPVNSNMVRVCQKYFENPSENFAIYDYGAILLQREKAKPRRGFGFGLMLSMAPSLQSSSNQSGGACNAEQDPLQGRLLYVSGYRPKDSPASSSENGKEPRRSEGNCLRALSSQLVYRADTEAGMSGGPVWLGFRGAETVVAIHNYGGGDEKNPKNKGSRINLEVWRTVCTWAGAMWTNKSLHYYPPAPPSKSTATADSSPTYQMHLHMQMPVPMPDVNSTYIDEIGSGRVRVGCPGPVETFFDILPVAAQPTDGESLVCYGFLLTKYAIPKPDDEDEDSIEGTVASQVQSSPTSPILGKKKNLWLHWNPTSNQVSVAEYLDAHVEVRLQNLVQRPQIPFAMQVRVDNGWMQAKMDRQYLMDADLEPLTEEPELYEDTTEVSFIKVAKEKCFKFQD